MFKHAIPQFRQPLRLSADGRGQRLHSALDNTEAGRARCRSEMKPLSLRLDKTRALGRWRWAAPVHKSRR